MATKKAIVNILNLLSKSVNSEKVVKIDVTKPTVKKLIKLLITEEVLTVLQKTEHKLFVTVNKCVTIIGCTPKFENYSKEQIVFEAAKLLKTINGTLIVTTTAGLMTHRQAIEMDIGGRVIGFFQ